KPMSAPMMAMTTSNSISVKASRTERTAGLSRQGTIERRHCILHIMNRRFIRSLNSRRLMECIPRSAQLRPATFNKRVRAPIMASKFCFLLLSLMVGCGHKPPYEGKSVAQLERMLKDGDADAQSQAAYGLSLHGPDAAKALPALVDALASPHTLVR